MKYTNEDIMRAFMPWGYRDIEELINTLNVAEIDLDEYVDYVNDYMEQCDVKDIASVDCVAIAFDMALQQARTDIENATNKDICNDYDLSVYGNYMCSAIDGRDNENVKALIDTIPQEDRTSAINWLYDEL